MKPFEQMANEDPEISHMMAYRRVRQFVRFMDRLHRDKARKNFIVAVNNGGIANVGLYRAPRIEQCADWEECADTK